MKRIPGLTAAHSRRIDNHVHRVALCTTFYNFARIDGSVRMFAAMGAKIADRLWEFGDIVKLIEAHEAA